MWAGSREPERTAPLRAAGPAPWQEAKAWTHGHLEPGESVGGHRGPRRQPLGEARAVGLGHPERGGQVAAEVDEKGAVVVARPHH